MTRCALCDAERGKLDVIEAFTLGAGLSVACDGLESLRETLCTHHRTRHVMAMMTLRMKVDALESAPVQGSDK